MTKRKYQEEKGARIGGINEDELMNLADLFKMFADSTRIKILVDLSQGEKSVSEICEDLEMNQSAVSAENPSKCQASLHSPGGEVHDLFSGGRPRKYDYRNGQRSHRRVTRRLS